MKLLLLIVSMMTFTVTDKRTVTADGLWPYDMSATYYNTGSKGSVTSKDTATLSVGGLDGVEVQQVRIYMRSNKSTGAGVVYVTVNGDRSKVKEGSYKDWFGAYNNTDYQALELLTEARKHVGAMEIQIVGTENSLHIEKYEIVWTQAQVYTVTLMAGQQRYQTLTELYGGAGVVLPELMVYDESWEFAGWSETPFWSLPTGSWPEMYYAGMTYHPTEDCTLYAVYQREISHPQTYVTDLEDGVYLYVNSQVYVAMRGVPENGKIVAASVSAYDEQQFYEIDFHGTDTAFITHAMTETPIGYSGTQLAAVASPWRVYHADDETLFYATVNGQNYVLWYDLLEECFGLLKADPMTSPMRLQTTLVNERELEFTCYPEAEGIITVNGERMSGERSVSFGIYNLKIINGRKYLELR